MHPASRHLSSRSAASLWSAGTALLVGLLLAPCAGCGGRPAAAAPVKMATGGVAARGLPGPKPVLEAGKISVKLRDGQARVEGGFGSIGGGDFVLAEIYDLGTGGLPSASTTVAGPFAWGRFKVVLPAHEGATLMLKLCQGDPERHQVVALVTLPVPN